MDTKTIMISLIVASGFGAMFYLQYKNQQDLLSAVGGTSATPTTTGSSTVSTTAPSSSPSAAPAITMQQPQGNLPSQQILVFGGAAPQGSISPALLPLVPPPSQPLVH